MTKVQKAHTNTQKWNQDKYVSKSHQGVKLNNQVKQLQGMTHILQRNLTVAYKKDQVKPPKIKQ